MEVVGEGSAGERVRPADAARAGVSRAVHRPVHRGRLSADVFHDVDFAALRPADALDVVAKHPERRPEALPAWDANARLESAVGLSEVAFGLYPC